MTTQPRFYAGIGSRETPRDVLELMTTFAQKAAQRGWVLRSGAAPGADQAFEEGCDSVHGPKQIYVPWPGFQGRSTNDPFVVAGVHTAALDLASQFHPAWHLCSPAARKLHARNCYQILGWQLDKPVQFVICWTRNGSGAGGTGQALRIAKAYNIPIHDLGNNITRAMIEEELRS